MRTLIKHPEVSIVIPFYNEESNVKECYKIFREEIEMSKISFEVILVDNGSRDKTQNIIRELSKLDKRVQLVVVPNNIGYGWGVLQGLRKCSGGIIGWIDGDNQINPKYVALLYKCMKDTNSEVGISERVTRYDSLQRKILSWTYNILFKVLYGVDVKDINAKPKMLNKSVFDALKLRSCNWFIDAELFINAKRSCLKICKIDVECKSRKKGRSNVKISTAFELFKDLLLFKLKSW